MQVFVVFSLLTVLWVVYGYSIAFNGPGEWVGDFSRLLLSGITADSNAATFTKGVVIPEFVFVVFQATFAAITTALAVGAFAERTKFTAVLHLRGDLVHLLVPAHRAHGLVQPKATCSSSAHSTTPAARWCTSTRVSRAWSAH